MIEANDWDDKPLALLSKGVAWSNIIKTVSWTSASTYEKVIAMGLVYGTCYKTCHKQLEKLDKI